MFIDAIPTTTQQANLYANVNVSLFYFEQTIHFTKSHVANLNIRRRILYVCNGYNRENRMSKYGCFVRNKYNVNVTLLRLGYG